MSASPDSKQEQRGERGGSHPAQSLLECVLQQHPDTPRKRAKDWIQSGRVSVDGVVARKPNLVVPTGGRVELLERQATAVVCEPGWAIHPRLTLLYLDASLAIVNKGAGLLAVPSPQHELSAQSVLTDFIVGKLKPRQAGPGTRTLPAAFRRLEPLPVHRIDKHTSGLLCFALNPTARENLIEQWSAHTIGREYIGYVVGRPRQRKGTWRHWLKASEDELTQFVISSHEAQAEKSTAVEAITHYEVLGEFRFSDGMIAAAKMRFRLETGRKHQIRVQAAHEGVPLIGERMYHGRANDRARELPEFARQALHAERLDLEHPEQRGKRLSWIAGLPGDLQKLEGELHRLR